MSIASGYKKFKKYILTSSGFQLVSHWTKANTLEFDDGKTAQDKLGAIDGISSSRESNSDKIAASTALVSELNSDLGGIQFDVDEKGNALAQYTFDGNVKTVNLGGEAMTLYGLYGKMDSTGTSNTISIPVTNGEEYTIEIRGDTYAVTSAVLSSMTGATVLSTISERNFNNALNKSWVHIKRIKATSNTITLTGTMGSSYSNVVWAALFTA
mgnify:CR=1 FL=1